MINKGTPRGVIKLERISVERDQEEFAASLLPVVDEINDPVKLIRTVTLKGRTFDYMVNMRTGTEFIHERKDKPIKSVKRHNITVKDIW